MATFKRPALLTINWHLQLFMRTLGATFDWWKGLSFDDVRTTFEADFLAVHPP